MIAEPIQGVGGFTIPPDGLFAALKEVLDEYGILFISDEVQTGWGRTGDNFWGYEAHGITPDLLTFAKGLGNGLSMAGVIGRGERVDGREANTV
jgi:4-aminobutyrate aminotransferase